MSKLALGLTLVLAGIFALPAESHAKSTRKDQTTETAQKTSTAPLDKEQQQKLREHMRMREHVVKGVKYPATKDELLKAFKGFRDIKADDRKWFEETLPNKTFDAPEDVMKALGWEVQPNEGATTAAKSK